MLHRLYIHGPSTPGIFRKSGSHRDLLELKARLDAGEECNINDVSIHVVAAAVKVFSSFKSNIITTSLALYLNMLLLLFSLLLLLGFCSLWRCLTVKLLTNNDKL